MLLILFNFSLYKRRPERKNKSLFYDFFIFSQNIAFAGSALKKIAKPEVMAIVKLGISSIIAKNRSILSRRAPRKKAFGKNTNPLLRFGINQFNFSLFGLTLICRSMGASIR
jgi:hypothetical protein